MSIHQLDQYFIFQERGGEIIFPQASVLTLLKRVCSLFLFVLQTRSPKLSQSPQPSLGDQAEYLSEVSVDSLEVMSEAEALSPFARGSRTRASLPVVRTTNQTKERSLGKTSPTGTCLRLCFTISSIALSAQLYCTSLYI